MRSWNEELDEVKMLEVTGDDQLLSQTTTNKHDLNLIVLVLLQSTTKLFN